MEIEVGEYVRTKQGYIAKLIKIDKELGILEFDKPIYKESYKPTNIIMFDQFNKRVKSHSSELIDLIEECDYVNGIKVNFVGITAFRTGKKEKVLHMVSDAYCEYADMMFAEHIKRVVTNERFKSEEYEVGEE